MQIRSDIHVGRATVKAAYRGGWALPGGEITDDEHRASAAAHRLHQIIGSAAFEEENRKALQALRGGRGR